MSGVAKGVGIGEGMGVSGGVRVETTSCNALLPSVVGSIHR